MSSGENITNHEENNEWDILNPEYDANWHADQAHKINKDFGERLETLSRERAQMGPNEFNRWEDDLGEEYNKTLEVLYNDGKTFEEAAEIIEKTIIADFRDEKSLMNTVEAYSGNYYYERRQALYQAIDNADKPEEQKNEEREYLNTFFSRAMEHIALKTMPPELVREYGARRHDEDQTKIHNDVIKLLNTLNDLARDYQLRPFTPRNFVPSDVVERSRQTPAERNIMSYDRYTVIAYYTTAFPGVTERTAAQYKNDY